MITLGAFNPIVMSAVINLQIHSKNSYGEIIGYFYAKLCVFLLCILFLVELYVFTRPLKVLQSDNFKKKWGFFYEDYQDKSKMQMIPMLIVPLRRLALLLVAFYMG